MLRLSPRPPENSDRNKTVLIPGGPRGRDTGVSGWLSELSAGKPLLAQKLCCATGRSSRGTGDVLRLVGGRGLLAPPGTPSALGWGFNSRGTKGVLSVAQDP